MPFNINEFSARISKEEEFAVASYFDAMCFGPKQIRTTARPQSTIENSFQFRIQSIDYPGRGAGIVPFSAYGVPHQIGTMLNYIPITMTILLSPNLAEREYFLAWQDLIGGNHRVRDRRLSVEDLAKSHDIGYYDVYAKNCILEIHQYEMTGKRTHTTKFLNCWPSFVGNITGSWDSGEFHKMQVTMNYRYFVDEYVLNNKPF